MILEFNYECIKLDKSDMWMQSERTKLLIYFFS